MSLVGISKLPTAENSAIQLHPRDNVAIARVPLSAGAELHIAGLRLIARAAQGSVRDGLSLLDQCFATGDRPVTADTCRRALGLANARQDRPRLRSEERLPP